MNHPAEVANPQELLQSARLDQRLSSTEEPKPSEAPTMKPFMVEIVGGDGRSVQLTVMAMRVKDALACVLDDLAVDHPLWEAPGWSVQVYPRHTAFRLSRS